MMRVELDAQDADIGAGAREPDSRVAAQGTELEDILCFNDLGLEFEEFALGGGDGDVGEAFVRGVGKGG